MFEKFMRANANDFRQRYEGTFGYFKNDGGKMLAKLSHIRDEVCVFVDSRGIEYKLYPDSTKDIGFEFIPPKPGFHQTESGVYLIRRLAARQFQRGLTSKNTEITRLENGRFQPMPVNFDSLAAVFEKELVPTKITDTTALSEQLAVSGGYVYLFNSVIGRYTTLINGKYAVKLDQPELFKTEVIDAFRRLNTEVTVE